ncbi:putative endopolygalacturonase [Marasmius fiardii PR-910]|nr:putative endopolygalacturonase [Marasmius fiardii PR-910]
MASSRTHCFGIFSPLTIAVFAFFLTPLVLLRVQAAECVVEGNNDGTDDSQHILQAFESCKENGVIQFQQRNYSAYTPISLTDLKNVTIHLEGNLNLPNNISQVQQAINVTQNQRGTSGTIPWFYFSGEDVSLIGSDNSEWGRFNGFGQQWWDIGNRTLRPQLASFNVTNGLLRGLKVIKPIAWGWHLPGTNIRVENHFVDAKPYNSTRDSTVVGILYVFFKKNCINVSGNNITIDGYYGLNGDDCISIINGARNVLAQNGYCGFSSHGLSIGSLGRGGSEQTVQNVVFRNWIMDGAVYGARFKSWTGGRGWADNITWEDITLVNVSTGIFITQNYYDQDIGPRPQNTNQTSTRISNFVFKNFTGGLNPNWTDGSCISNPCWNFVQGGDSTQAIIFDLYPGTALNITVQDINIHPFNKSENATTVICDPSTLASGEQDTLGFQCHNGPFIATPIKVGELKETE